MINDNTLKIIYYLILKKTTNIIITNIANQQQTIEKTVRDSTAAATARPLFSINNNLELSLSDSLSRDEQNAIIAYFKDNGYPIK
jgi:hypothetical protein